MAKRAESLRGGINVATLKPPRNLQKLRADLKTDAGLRKELAENPNAVLTKYGLSVDLPSGTLSRLSSGGGITFPTGVGIHADQHIDAHVDVDPHIDINPHIDLL
jgi:hypothetical protein